MLNVGMHHRKDYMTEPTKNQCMVRCSLYITLIHWRLGKPYPRCDEVVTDMSLNEHAKHLFKQDIHQQVLR